MTVVNYCPKCGSKLAPRADGGRERPACAAAGCGFVYYGEFSVGCGAVVLRDRSALLVRRKPMNGRGGFWQIPGGYVEIDEEFETALQREVLEETGVDAHFRDVVGFRHAQSLVDRPKADLYVVCRLSPLGGEPRGDGVETSEAAYFSLEDLEKMGRVPPLPATATGPTPMDRVTGISLWAVRAAFNAPEGFRRIDGEAPGLLRPGQTLFGHRDTLAPPSPRRGRSSLNFDRDP